MGTVGGATRLRRRMVERVLTVCETAPTEVSEPLLILLRRFATESAREEARVFCDELVAEAAAEPALEEAPVCAPRFSERHAFEPQLAEPEPYEPEPYEPEPYEVESYELEPYEPEPYEFDHHEVESHAIEPYAIEFLRIEHREPRFDEPAPYDQGAASRCSANCSWQRNTRNPHARICSGHRRKMDYRIKASEATAFFERLAWQSCCVDGWE